MRNSSVTFLHSAGPALLRRLWGPASGAPRCPGAPELWVSFVGGSSLPSWALCLPNIVKLVIYQTTLGECWSFSSRTVELYVPNLNALLLGCLSSVTFPALPQGNPRVLPGRLSWAGHTCSSKGCDGTSIFWLLRDFMWASFAHMCLVSPKEVNLFDIWSCLHPLRREQLAFLQHLLA